MGAHEHLRHAGLTFGVITASDTRDAAGDASGRLITEMVERAGHRVAHYEILPDEPARIRAAVEAALPRLDGIIVTGGTGIAARDQTIEALRPLLDKEMEGFGELFRMLSYGEVGAAAILSRAMAGTSRGKLIVALPGAPKACGLALEKLLIPQLGHIGYLLGLGRTEAAKS